MKASNTAVAHMKPTMNNGYESSDDDDDEEETNHMSQILEKIRNKIKII